MREKRNPELVVFEICVTKAKNQRRAEDYYNRYNEMKDQKRRAYFARERREAQKYSDRKDFGEDFDFTFEK